MGVVIPGHSFTPVNLYSKRSISVDISLYRCLGCVAPLDEIHSKIAHNLCTIDRSAQSPGINVIQVELTSE